MAEQSKLNVRQTGNKLILSREYDAPKELVFSMFKNPEHLAKWWGPTTWPATIVSFDFKPQGVWHYYMAGPDGEKAWGKATFQEIQEPDSLSYIDVFSDEAGNTDETKPQGLSTVTFEENDGKTTLRIVGEYKSAEEVEELIKMGMIEGMEDTLGQLDRLVAANR